MCLVKEKRKEWAHTSSRRRKRRGDWGEKGGERNTSFSSPRCVGASLAGVAAVGAELHAGTRAAALGAELGAGRRRCGRGRGRGRSLRLGGRRLGRLGLDLLLGQRTLVDLDLAGVRVARTVRRQGAAAATKAKALLAKELVVARVAVHHTLALGELGDLKLLAAVLAASSTVRL